MWFTTKFIKKCFFEGRFFDYFLDGQKIEKRRHVDFCGECRFFSFFFGWFLVDFGWKINDLKELFWTHPYIDSMLFTYFHRFWSWKSIQTRLVSLCRLSFWTNEIEFKKACCFPLWWSSWTPRYRDDVHLNCFLVMKYTEFRKLKTWQDAVFCRWNA